MKQTAYAVVKDFPGRQYQFTKWHDLKDDAIAEAKRLAGVEGRTFLVLQLIGWAEVEDKPVKVTMLP